MKTKQKSKKEVYKEFKNAKLVRTLSKAERKASRIQFRKDFKSLFV